MLLWKNDRLLQQQQESTMNTSSAVLVDQAFCDAQCPYQEPTTWVSALPFALQIIMIIILPTNQTTRIVPHWHHLFHVVVTRRRRQSAQEER